MSNNYLLVSTVTRMRQSLVCDSHSCETVTRMRQSLVCDSPSYETVTRMRQSLVCNRHSYATDANATTEKVICCQAIVGAPVRSNKYAQV